MKRINTLWQIILVALLPFIYAVKSQTLVKLKLFPNEQWWGGADQFGYKMPFNAKNDFSFDLYGNNAGNQAAPLLISNKGRWIWCDEPFKYSFKNDSLIVQTIVGNIKTGTSGDNLASAYHTCAQQFFPSSGLMPDSLLMTSPQYNLWIELLYNPNQKDVLKYADAVLKNNFPAGVLMVDDNWFNYYGQFDFNKEKFPDAKQTFDALHQKGFKVMVWICPFISPDSDNFRVLRKKKLLLMDSEGDLTKTWKAAKKPLLIEWWNGYSACLDFTNPEATAWLIEKLKFLQTTYGVDGFKLDAGDADFYNNKNLLAYKKVTPNEHSEAWVKIGLSFPLNEYRAAWKTGGQPVVQRLRDKSHSWEDLQILIPNTIAQQLLGYTFTCPDMIGGGEWTSFLPGAALNQNLIVRSAQVHALMPMMQFSVAPWRVLDTAHFSAVKEAVTLRQKMLPQIMAVIKASVKTGEPVIRPLEYNYPNLGLENIKDEFMVGNEILVAPVVTESDERKVVLPAGTWIYQNKNWAGGKTYSLKVQLNELPVFIKTH